MRFIGDVHGKYKQYRELIRGIPASIQVGDMGLGFYKTTEEMYPNPPHYAMVQGNHRFIRGNHDNPNECKKHSQYIPDGYVEGNTMFIGGAFSVDRAYRTEGLNWWEDEQLSYQELFELMDIYEKTKPEIMVTHDCPFFFYHHLKTYKVAYVSRTSQAFDNMFELHKPKTWIFGHHHKDHKETVKDCEFICLGELSTLDL